MGHKRKTDFREIARKLRSYGYRPKYGSGKKGSGSPQAKAGLLRTWEKVRLFAVAGKAAKKGAYKFKFVRADTREKREAMKGLNPKVRTPAGFFVRVPTGAKRYRVSFKGSVLKVSAEGIRGGKREERIFRLDPRKLAQNPRAEIERVTGKRAGKFQEGRLVVNGHDSHTIEHNSLAEFEKYVAAFFLQSQDPNRAGAMKGRYHGRKISAQTFADIFHIKLITQTASPHGHKKHAKKRRRR